MSIIKYDNQTNESEGANTVMQAGLSTIQNEAGKAVPNNATVVSDGVLNRVVLGYQKDGFGTGKNYGIKVSQDGYDVLTATNDQLVMSSAFNNLKIFQQGTVSLTRDASVAAGSGVSIDVPHSLGKVPMVIAYADSGGGARPLPVLLGSWTGGGSSYTYVLTRSLFANVSSSTVTFFYTAGFTGLTETWNIKYYILTSTTDN